MIGLVPPDPAHQDSYLAAGDEFLAEGHGELTECVLPRQGDFPGVWFTRESMVDPARFAAMCAFRRELADEDALRPPSWVATTTLWVVEHGTFLGTVSVRHTLTPELLELGGHIGYSVRPSARRRGVATEALRLALPVAAGLGIDPALVTCDESNTASRRVIEANGGVLEDVRGVKRRYWVPTAG